MLSTWVRASSRLRVRLGAQPREISGQPGQSGTSPRPLRTGGSRSFGSGRLGHERQRRDAPAPAHKDGQRAARARLHRDDRFRPGDVRNPTSPSTRPSPRPKPTTSPTTPKPTSSTKSAGHRGNHPHQPRRRPQNHASGPRLDRPPTWASCPSARLYVAVADADNIFTSTHLSGRASGGRRPRSRRS